MQRSSRTTARVRAQAIGLTLLAHGVVALLLIELERRTPRRSDAPQLQYVSIWPEPLRERQRIEEAPARVQQRKSATRASLAIQMPVETPVPQSTDLPPPTVGQHDPVQAPVDWNAAAMAAAKRFAQGNGALETFSPPPQPQRKSCKPRQFDEQTQALMTQRLPPPPDPDAVGADPTANCIIVGGYPKCVQKINLPRKRSSISTDLLAQRAGGLPPAQSVPSIEQCE